MLSPSCWSSLHFGKRVVIALKLLWTWSSFYHISNQVRLPTHLKGSSEDHKNVEPLHDFCMGPFDRNPWLQWSVHTEEEKILLVQVTTPLSTWTAAAEQTPGKQFTSSWFLKLQRNAFILLSFMMKICERSIIHLKVGFMLVISHSKTTINLFC